MGDEKIRERGEDDGGRAYKRIRVPAFGQDESGFDDAFIGEAANIHEAPIVFGETLREGNSLKVGKKYLKRRVNATAYITMASIASGEPILMESLSNPVPNFTYFASRYLGRGFFRGKISIENMGNLNVTCDMHVDTMRHSKDDGVSLPVREAPIPSEVGKSYIRVIPRAKDKKSRPIRHLPYMIGPVPGGVKKTLPYNFKLYPIAEGNGFNVYVTVVPRDAVSEEFGGNDIVLRVSLIGYIRK